MSSYQEIWALKDINFHIQKGEKVGLIGANGAGKTTLIRIMSGLYSQTTGTVKVDGKISAFIQLGIGLQRDLTALENIYLIGAIMGFKREEVSRRVDNILDFAELKDFIYCPVKDFSTGMV